MRDTKTLAYSIGMAISSIALAIAAFRNEVDFELICYTFLLVVYLVKKHPIHLGARLVAATAFGFTALVSLFRVEAPFPLMFELWGDLSHADLMTMLTAIESFAISCVLLDHHLYRAQASTLPPAGTAA